MMFARAVAFRKDHPLCEGCWGWLLDRQLAGQAARPAAGSSLHSFWTRSEKRP